MVDSEEVAGDVGGVDGEAETARRRFLKQAGVGAAASGALWVAPQVLGSRHVAAAAATGSPPDPPDPTPSWVQLSPLPAPPARASHAMARDGAGNVVLFGGMNGQDALGDTWVWDGSTWTEKKPDHSPPPRVYPRMARDPSGGVVLFGGADNAGYPTDTWVWNGSDWSEKSPGSSPPPRRGHAMARYGPEVAGNVVLFGGENYGPMGDTWVWDGSDWTQKNPAHSPSPRSFHAMARGPSDGVVLVGGSGHSDTWGWDGSDWTQKNPVVSPPPFPTMHVLARDAVGNVVMLIGVPTQPVPPLGNTWLWDDSTWTRQSTDPSPSSWPGRAQPAMARDALGKVVLFGGWAGGPWGDTWVWG